MTRAFSPAQKFRILVAFDAQVIVNDTLVPIARFAYGTESDEKRFRLLQRKLDCAVKCACGCDTWAPLNAIEFDHRKNWASGGRSTLDNGQPLRTYPCHRNEKCAGEQVVTGWVRKVKRKLLVTITRDDSTSKESRPRKRSWPQRSFPKSSRPMQSRGFQKRWEPRT